jgi:hypothetical protein
MRNETSTTVAAVPIKAWKHDLHNSMSMFEAVAEGSIRMCETQLKTATELHEQMDTARKLLGEATDAKEMWQIQSEWFSATLDQTFALWSEVGKVAAETQSNVGKLLYNAEGPFVTQASGLPQGSKTALGLLDETYKHWCDNTRQFYAAAAGSTNLLTDIATDEAEAEASTAAAEKPARNHARKAKSEEA